MQEEFKADFKIILNFVALFAKIGAVGSSKTLPYGFNECCPF